jgi:hypothetical protein
MTKQELIDALQGKVEFSTRQSKAELQDLYDKLHVHKVEPVVPFKEVPGEEETPGEELPGEETPGEETPGEEKPGEEKPDATDFDELLGKIEGADIPHPKEKVDKPLIEKTKRKRKKGESSPDSFRMEGYVLLLLVDTVFPFALAWINNMLDKKVKVDSSDLILSEKDFAKLEPLADQAADYMAVNLNPIAGFFIVASFMYGNNLLTLRLQLNKE